MAWYEDQTTETEGFDSPTMMNVLQIWLPIRFQTRTVHPVAQQKLFADLTPAQRQSLGPGSEAVIMHRHILTTADRDALRGALQPSANSNVGMFSAAVGAGARIFLPSGWLTAALGLSVKTLVSYLLQNDATRERTSFLAANLSAGGELRECWHSVNLAPQQSFFYRVIEYEVKSGTELRHFVLQSTRYALRP